MEMRIGMVHYVRGFNKCAKWHHATYRGSAPTNTWNIKVVSFFIFFYFICLKTIFFNSPTGRTDQPIFMVDGWKRVF